MNLSSREFLMLGSVASFLIALLHITLALRPQWYHCFGADELVQLHNEGSRFSVFVTLGLALMFASWGVYALSGANVIRQLPLLRTVLIAASVIYLLRSLVLPGEIVKALTSGHSLRFVVFSTGSLAAGLLYLVGTFWR